MNFKKTILMADDDADDCFMASEAFAETGSKAAFSCVSDGVELLNSLAENARSKGPGLPDLILLDLNMPRKNGADALFQIKSHPVFKKIPIVILTTSNEKEVAVKIRAMADAFITKPATFGEWVEIMNSIAKKLDHPKKPTE